MGKLERVVLHSRSRKIELRNIFALLIFLFTASAFSQEAVSLSKGSSCDFELVQNRRISPTTRADLTKLAEFLDSKVVPEIESDFKIDIPHSTVLFGDLNDKYHFSGYFDGELSPNHLMVDIFAEGTSRILPPEEITKNFVHELQHLYLWSKQKNTEWALNELLSLMWQEHFLQMGNETDIRAAQASKEDPLTFKRNDSASYGRLNLIARQILARSGEKTLIDFYKSPTSSLKEFIAGLLIL